MSRSMKIPCYYLAIANVYIIRENKRKLELVFYRCEQFPDNIKEVFFLYVNAINKFCIKW